MNDPVSFEVLKSALACIAEEMSITIVRTAHSQVVRDSLDFSTAVCDAAGRVVAQGCGIPLHLGAIPDAMVQLQKKFPGEIRAGDVFILNDPDEGGMHLPDVFIIRPVFDDRSLVGYVACVAHYPDIGGRVAGGNAVDSTEIFEEGLQIPLIKLCDQGRIDANFVELLLRNVRIPDIVNGDLQAQLAACHVGAEELAALASRHGKAALQELMAEILDYSETRLRNEISALPEGEYRFRDYIDDDGFGSGTIAIEVAVTISAGSIVADFAGTSTQVRSALNATMSFTRAAVYAAVKCIVDDDIPSNEGFYRPIEVRAPAGTVLNPLRPAPRAARGLTGYRAFDAVMGALSLACPEQAMAAGEGGASMIAITGRRPDGEPFILVDFVTGGWGARPDGDGPDGNSPIAANLSNVPVEEIEARYPVRVERYGFVPDTGGAGRRRGALSVERRYRLLGCDGLLQVRSDRQEHLPYGLSGGSPGTPSENVLDPDGPACRRLPPSVVVPIAAGQSFRHVTAGGGGYGPPGERNRSEVLDDVLDGKLTPAYARRAYALGEERREGDPRAPGTGGGAGAG